MENTIIAHDVFNESTFTASFLGNDYGLVTNWMMKMTLYKEGLYYNEFNINTDKRGQIVLDLALEPANYTVLIHNMFSGQYAEYNWTIIQRDKAKESKINVTVDGFDIIYNLIDGAGNIVEDARIKVYANETLIRDSSKNSFNYYSMGEGRYLIEIFYNDFYYYPSNATQIVDVIDTIQVNDSFYNTTKIDALLLDYNGNPIKNALFSMETDDTRYAGMTDENGHAIADLSVLPGTYEVSIRHDLAKQSKKVILEVLEEYDYKKAIINTVQDGFRIIFNVTDLNGNKIDGGGILVENAFMADNVYTVNGTATCIYSPNIYDPNTDGERLLFITFTHQDFYTVETEFTFNFVNTVISSDVNPGKAFTATFLDMDKNPIPNMEVLFEFHKRDGSFEPLGNLTLVTDENGVISIVEEDAYFDVIVTFSNQVTGQPKRHAWVNKEIAEITPVFDYFDESNGTYYVNGNMIVFEFSPSDVTGNAILECEDYAYNSDVRNGIIKIWVPEFGDYTWTIFYKGSSKYNASFCSFHIVNREMSLPTLTVSEDLVVDYSDGSKFTVKLTNGSSAISNASVEIRIGNNAYVLCTDDEGNAIIPVNLDAGKYDVFVNYKGSPDYICVNKTTSLTVNKAATKVISSKITSVYGTGKNLVVTLKDANGKILVGKKVSVKLNGVTYNKVTDNKGQISIAVSKTLTPKTYDASIAFAGDGNYLKSTGSVKVTVNKATSKLIVKKKTFRKTKKVKKYAVTLKSKNGKAIKKAKLTLKVKGKTYKATTNSKGKATFKITKLTRTGTFKAAIKFNGDKYYKASNKNVKIRVK